MRWDQVLARRLARHHLATPVARKDLVDLVGAICGIHAQVMPSAELSLGLRVRGLTAKGLADALWKSRELVKTYGPRGTVHLLPARELGFWLAALRDTGRADDDADRLAYLGMTAKDLAAIADAIAGSLSDVPLTREQLGAAVAKRVGRWTVERTVVAFGGQSQVWQAGIGVAARRGILCFGPPVGTKVTFVRAESWLGRFTVPDAAKAQRELLRRFLAAYGPATHREFAQWATIAPARAKELVVELGDEIEEVDVDGARAVQIAGDRAARVTQSTLLVPRFDVFVVGAHPRDVTVPPDVVKRAAATGLLRGGIATGRAYLAGPMPVILMDGVVSGIWESKRSSRRIDIVAQPLVRLDATRRDELEACAMRLGEILGLDATLVIGKVKTLPHL
jgi:uncharacterized protein YcaQ